MKDKLIDGLYPLLYRVINTVLVVGIVLHTFGRVFGVTEINVKIWVLVIPVTLLLAWLNFGQTNSKIISGVILSLGGIILLPLIMSGGIIDFWQDYFHWLFRIDDYSRDWLVGYQMMQTVWIVLLSYVFQILTEKIPLIKLITVIVLFMYLLVSMFLEKRMSHVGVVLSVAYMVLCYLETIRIGWSKKKKRDSREYMIWLMPFVALYLCLLLIIPVREEPYDWKFVHEVYANIREKVIIYLQNKNQEAWEDFNFALAGFSEDGKLADGFSSNNREIMNVQSGQALLTNIYLSGKTYDTFDGREWTQSEYESISEYPLDIMETLYAVSRFDDEMSKNYIKSTHMTVTYSDFYTGYIFVPAKATRIINTPYLMQGRDVLFEEQKGYQTTYEVAFYQVNINTPNFMEMIESDLPEEEEVWNQVVTNYNGINDKRFTLNELKQYRNDVKEIFYDEVTVSEEVRNYLDEIIAGCETDYSKLKAIEGELLRYAYTNDPPRLPSWVKTQEDFLDFFLLESKQGYCSYFASAFALLARAEGFPTRYVEGFCIPIQPKKEMVVTSSMAHAWPEVYLEGIGWIPFEPTPGYSSIRYAGWKVQEPKEETEAEPIVPTTPQPIIEAVPEEVPIEEEVSAAENTKQLLNISKWLLFILAMGGLVLVIERARQRYRYRHMTTEQKFLVEVKRNLWIYARLGYKRQETETLSEIKERIERIYWQIVSEKEIHFLKDYQEYLYRGTVVTEEMLKTAIAEREEVLMQIKKDERAYYYILSLRMLFSFSG